MTIACNSKRAESEDDPFQNIANVPELTKWHQLGFEVDTWVQKEVFMAATTEFCNSPPSQTAWKQIKFFFFYRENLLLVQVWQNKPAGHFFLSLPDQDMKKNPRVLFFQNVKRASRLVQSFNAATMKYILLPFDLQCKEKRF